MSSKCQVFPSSYCINTQNEAGLQRRRAQEKEHLPTARIQEQVEVGMKRCHSRSPLSHVPKSESKK